MRETPEEQLPEFARRIRRFRKALGLTIHRFAALLDVPEASVSRWEHGKFMPSFWNLERMYRLGQERQVYAQIFPILDFESVFFLSDVWKEEMREGYHRMFLRATVTNTPGVTAQVLTVIARHEGNLLRVAGFQRVAEGSNESVLRILLDLPPHRSQERLDADINALEDVIATEFPVDQM